MILFVSFCYLFQIVNEYLATSSPFVDCVIALFTGHVHGLNELYLCMCCLCSFKKLSDIYASFNSCTSKHFLTLVTHLSATSLFKLLLKYRPEDKAAKKERLLKRAQAETEGKTVEAKKPIVVKYGLNHVTYLIEQVITCSILISSF